MATSPVYFTTPIATTPGTLTAANTATDGTGATGRALIATAPASEDMAIPLVRVTPLGTQVKSLVRLFLNNGSDPEVAGNNSYLGEIEMPATTQDNDDPSLFPQDYDFRTQFGEPGLVLLGDASTPQRLYATLATAVAVGVRIIPINAATT